jgi:hypothetical protein
MNKRKLMFSLLVLFSFSASATETDYLTITRYELTEVTPDPLGFEIFNSRKVVSISSPDPLEVAGKVIKTAKDLVALGEDLYKLVVKGKPTSTTTYAPISVIPKVDGLPVDLLSTEYWHVPEKRSYQMVYENAYGMDVVKFRYSVIYAWGGSYAGRGKYLTSVQVVPESVDVSWGFDFSATMKLGGIQNNGSQLNPIAGATILLEHNVSNTLKNITQVHTFFVAGDGVFKRL